MKKNQIHKYFRYILSLIKYYLVLFIKKLKIYFKNKNKIIIPDIM